MGKAKQKLNKFCKQICTVQLYHAVNPLTDLVGRGVFGPPFDHRYLIQISMHLTQVKLVLAVVLAYIKQLYKCLLNTNSYK
jgi:C4-dicarboxylate transporter